jgi:hypothetical protein
MVGIKLDETVEGVVKSLRVALHISELGEGQVKPIEETVRKAEARVIKAKVGLDEEDRDLILNSHKMLED